ncbi:insulin-like growth factor 2 mRNA-binding protein 2 [Montipora foliosa]|uniref:insulin-like growth factor 2 mRNA-binding protein 2 n=1 Tax=Montipora foliosa TaxID=591990 RepID=UPI0035F11716
MECSGREEPQGAVGPSLEHVTAQFSYLGDDELQDERDCQSPDSGRRNGSRSGKRSRRNRQYRECYDHDYFIRVLVPHNMVGAIIGKEGKKIKDLTDKTGTDITVHKKDEKGYIEKVVEIVGTPAQCTEANLSIHRTMRAETDPAKRGPMVSMRVLVHGGIIARVIGRGHQHLSNITDTTKVSSVRAYKEDCNPFNHMDRVITIQYKLPSEAESSLDEETVLNEHEEEALRKCSEAENMVNAKAHFCLKNVMEYRSAFQQYYMQHQQGPWPPMGGPLQSPSPQNQAFVPNWFQGLFGNVSQGYMHLAHVPVKIHLTFPAKFAGPLIGKQASNLAHIKKFSGASKIHVFPKDREVAERYIEIIGTPLQQYFAQHCVYCKLAEEGYKTNSGDNVGELKLKTEIFVPLKGGSKDQPNIIGRFIGKEGHNVKELQKQTGVRIKVVAGNEDSENKEAVILIEESFASGQRAQMQILDAIARCQCPPPRRQAPYS